MQIANFKNASQDTQNANTLNDFMTAACLPSIIYSSLNAFKRRNVWIPNTAMPQNMHIPFSQCVCDVKHEYE